MSEEQVKPKLKWYKIRLRVFALILPIIGFVIYLVLLWQPWVDCCGVHRNSAYFVTKDKIQNAVTYYAESHNQSLPILNGTYTNSNCSNCHVLNVSALITANGGLLRTYPDGLSLSASDNDNCGGNASLGCSSESSYIWIVGDNGVVYSFCAGAGCTTNNSDYQDVWP
jgi:hypothetical protein